MCYNNYYEILEINRYKYKYKHQTGVDYSKTTIVTDEVEKYCDLTLQNSITDQLSLNILETTMTQLMIVLTPRPLLQMMEYSIPSEKVVILSNESLFVIGILSLILHLSTKKTLEETSKAVLLNTSIISMVNTPQSAASLKGPALVDLDEGTSTGETLIFVLLLHYFAVKR